MQEKTIFDQLFPQPTGKNAYEDLARASDLLKRSVLWAEAQQRNTLSSRRRALGDLPVRQARALIEQAALKPALSPRRVLTAATTFPELTGLRDCARLLSAEMHVLFSEGRTAAALVSLAHGLRLARVPKSEMLIGGLVGSAIEGILFWRLYKHLDPLTLRDCDRVQVIVQEHAELDKDSAAQALRAEMYLVRDVQANLTKASPDEIQSFFTGFVDDDETSEYQLPHFGQILNNPLEKKRVIDGFVRGAEAHQERAQRYLADPTILPPEPKLPAGSPEARLSELFVPSYMQFAQRFLKSRIQLRLLYCHASIRRYRWEHERLPEALEVLKLGDWCVDPYTKNIFRFEKRGDSYELFSVGPTAENGQRSPVHLT